MKLKLLFPGLALLPALSALAGEPVISEVTPDAVANTTNRFLVSGMHCNGCAQGIASELKRTPGVAFASVSFSNQVATVAYDTKRTSVRALRKVIHAAGYDAKLAKP